MSEQRVFNALQPELTEAWRVCVSIRWWLSGTEAQGSQWEDAAKANKQQSTQKLDHKSYEALKKYPVSTKEPFEDVRDIVRRNTAETPVEFPSLSMT